MIERGCGSLGRCLLVSCLSVVCAAANSSQGAEKTATRNPATDTPPPIEVPEGFTVELVAGPPLVKYPMMATLDERGRLFIAESDGQNLGKEELLKQQPRFVRMLEDIDGDGKFDKSTIFADRLVMPEGGLWHNGSLYIMSAPYLWRLDDTDDDGVADRREKLVGEMDLIGNANQHGPYRTPAGRLLFSGGTFGYNLAGKDGRSAIKGNWASVFSCQVDGTDLRVESHAGINPVEVEFTPEGEMLGTCAIFDRVGGRCDALVHWVHGGTYAEKLRQPVLKQSGRYLPAAARWGQVAPAGLVRMRGLHFGDEYRGNLFACLYNTHELVRIHIERLGATFRAQHEPFLRSSSSAFHPADILEDADGSLLLLDTGAWLTMGCPLSKDTSHGNSGGIYRIRKVDGPVPGDPRGVSLNWNKARSSELTHRLDDARPAVCDRALAELVKRGNEAVPELAKAAREATAPDRRRQAVWALAQIGADPARVALCDAAADGDPGVRQSAVHALGVLREARAGERLMRIVVDDELPVRREAATALGLIGNPAAVPALFESLRTARDEFLEHALIYALIEIGAVDAIRAGLTDADSRVQRAALIALDQIDQDSLTREAVVPLLAGTDAELQQAAFDVVARRPTWAAEIISLLRGSLSADDLTPQGRAIITGAVTAFAANEQVQSLVARTLGRPETADKTLLVLLDAIGRIPQTQVPAGWIAPMERLLSHGDGPVLRQLLSSLASLDAKPLERPLRALAGDGRQSAALRLAALAIVARGRGSLDNRELAFLLEQLRTDAPPVEKLTAANALSAASLSADQLKSLLPVVRTAGPLELPSLLHAFAEAPREKRLEPPAARSIGFDLLASLAESPGLDSLPTTRIHAALGDYPAEVAAAAVRRFPQSAAGNAEQLAKVAAIESHADQGNSETGKLVFFSNRAACAGCHRIGDRGGIVGPDLSLIARVRTTRQLAEAILLPSATLANGFESYSVATASGKVLAGLIRRETADAIHLVSTDGKEQRIRRAEIEEIRPSAESIMPQGLDKQLTPEQLRDLVAFLRTLK